MTDTSIQPPVVVTMPQSAPSTGETIRGWLHTAFGGIALAIASMVGIQLPTAMKPAPMVTEATVSNAVGAAINPDNPQFKAAAEGVLLKVIQSGVPGQLIQAGGAAIGAGPIVTVGEEALRRMLIDVLQKQQGGKKK